MSVTVKVRNKDRLAAKLKQLAPEAQAALTEANGVSAKEMVGLAQSFVPRRTGKLAKSIKAFPPGEVPPAYSQGGRSPIETGAWVVSAGDSGVRYAHLVEFGTAPHPQPNLGPDHPGAKAQAYFFPAYRLVAKKHRGRATRAINKSIKKVAKA